MTDPTPQAALEIAQLATERKAFILYALPTEDEASSFEILRRAGFGSTGVQALMARPIGTPAAWPMLTEVGTLTERLELVESLARIFFEFHPRKFRTTLAVATARARDCRLFEVREGRTWLAGAMANAVETPDGATWGLYDVGVREASRRRGIGGRLVEAVAAEAPTGTDWLTLQCSRPTIGWYERLGFETVGEVTSLYLGG